MVVCERMCVRVCVCVFMPLRDVQRAALLFGGKDQPPTHCDGRSTVYRWFLSAVWFGLAWLGLVFLRVADLFLVLLSLLLSVVEVVVVLALGVVFCSSRCPWAHTHKNTCDERKAVRRQRADAQHSSCRGSERCRFYLLFSFDAR